MKKQIMLMILASAYIGLFAMENENKESNIQLLQVSKEINSFLINNFMYRTISQDNKPPKSRFITIKDIGTFDATFTLTKDEYGSLYKLITEQSKKEIISACKDKLQRILTAGADVNVQDNKGITALMMVAGSEELCQLLIERGALVNIQDCNGDTAFAAALDYPNKQACKFLAKHGANINGLDAPSGHNYLIHAIGQGQTKTAEALIEMGADVNDQNNEEKGTPIMMALSYRYNDIA